MVENLLPGQNLVRFGPNLVPKRFFVGFNSTRCYAFAASYNYEISRKTNEPKLRK